MIANKVVSYLSLFLLYFIAIKETLLGPVSTQEHSLGPVAIKELLLDPVSTQDPIIVCYYINN